MDTYEKYLLLGSLSFFFGCLAVSLIWLYTSPSPVSYMYSPALTPGQEMMAQDPSMQYDPVPESVMVYPSAANVTPPKTVTCFLEDPYRAMIAKKKQESGVSMTAEGEMDGDKLEVYVDENGNFSVFVIGPDAIGQPEACEVARGTGWKTANP